MHALLRAPDCFKLAKSVSESPYDSCSFLTSELDKSILKLSLVNAAVIAIGTIYKSGKGADNVSDNRSKKMQKHYDQILIQALPDHVSRAKIEKLFRQFSIWRDSRISHRDFSRLSASMEPDVISISNRNIDLPSQDLGFYSATCKSLAIET